VTTKPSAALRTVAELEAEIRALHKQLEVRDQVLAVLNRRLNRLEQADHAAAGVFRAATGQLPPGGGEAVLRAEVAELRDELERMRATKLFRYARPARAVYRRLRELG
jgi:prefoldin subunit 5